MQGPLVLAVLGSLASMQVAAVPQKNIWQRLDNYLEQRSPQHQNAQRQDDAASNIAVSYESDVPTPSSSSSSFTVGPATTLVQTVTGDSSLSFLSTSAAAAAPNPVTTVGPDGVNVIISTSSSFFITTSTPALGEVCTASVQQFYLNKTYVPTVYDTVTVTELRNATSSLSSSKGFYPTHNGTRSSHVGPTGTAAPSYVSATTTTTTTETSSVPLYTHNRTASSHAGPTGPYHTRNGTSSHVGPTGTAAPSFVDTTTSSEAFTPTAYANETSSSAAFANSTSLASSTEDTSSSFLPTSSAAFTNSTSLASSTSSALLSSTTGVVTNTTTPAAKPTSALPTHSTRSRTFANTTRTFTTRTRLFSSTEELTTTTAIPIESASHYHTFVPIPTSSESLIINTTLSATITGPIKSTPLPTSVRVTRTVTGPGLHHHHRGGRPHPTGVPPAPGTQYCGEHGSALGVFLLGTFFENEDNVPVTLEGCFQYCQVTRSSTPGKGCKSYYFHERDGLKGSTSCDLYGASVTDSLAKTDDSVDGVWYDLACGDPLKYE